MKGCNPQFAPSLHASYNWPKDQLRFGHFAKFGNLTKLPRIKSYHSNNWNDTLKRFLVTLAPFLPIQVNVEYTPPCLALHFNGPCPHLPSVPGSMGALFYPGNAGRFFKLCEEWLLPNPPLMARREWRKRCTKTILLSYLSTVMKMKTSVYSAVVHAPMLSLGTTAVKNVIWCRSNNRRLLNKWIEGFILFIFQRTLRSPWLRFFLLSILCWGVWWRKCGLRDVMHSLLSSF